jgi:hypothetical protein
MRQNTKRGYYNARKGKWTSCVATAVDEHEEGSSDQKCLTVSVEQAATENSYIPRVCSNDNRTGKLRSYLQRFGLIDNPMCYGSLNISM